MAVRNQRGLNDAWCVENGRRRIRSALVTCTYKKVIGLVLWMKPRNICAEYMLGNLEHVSES
jgi:hypothetical protein